MHASPVGTACLIVRTVGLGSRPKLKPPGLSFDIPFPLLLPFSPRSSSPLRHYFQYPGRRGLTFLGRTSRNQKKPQAQRQKIPGTHHSPLPTRDERSSASPIRKRMPGGLGANRRPYVLLRQGTWCCTTKEVRSHCAWVPEVVSHSQSPADMQAHNEAARQLSLPSPSPVARPQTTGPLGKSTQKPNRRDVRI